MKTLVKTVEGFDIYFEALNEDISLRDLLPDDTEEQLQEIEDNNVVFLAKVSAEKNGIELSEEYLGGCIYETEEDFYTKYENEYFADMVNTVVKDAKKQIGELNQNNLPLDCGMLSFSQEDINFIEANYSKDLLKRLQQSILCNLKDANMNDEYILELLKL